MIEVGKLRYGDVIVPTAGASGYVYVYLGRAGAIDGQAFLLIVGPHVHTEVIRMWIADPTRWNKV